MSTGASRASYHRICTGRTLVMTRRRAPAIKRFGYRGSNFIDRAVDNTLAEFDSDLLTAWMTDLDKELDKLK